MRRLAPAGLLTVCALFAATTASTLRAAPLAVTQISPARNSVAAPTAAVVIDFDKPVNPATVHSGTLRVFGRASGAKSGAYTFTNGNQRVTFQPAEPFAAGETVRINLSHSITAADLTTLRGAGWFYQFQVRTLAAGTFQQIGVLSNRIDDEQTRIYGAAATDLNNDGWIDLATVNEVSADVRVCLNRADGSGLYLPFLAPQPIGVESSPNDPADFDNDGDTDLCIAASSSNVVTVLLGAGDGTFASRQDIPVGLEPHAIAAIDVDGDGDADIVNANHGANQLALLVNNGAGFFAAPTSIEAGVSGEYGMAAADMNNDGIADLVVGGYDSQNVRVLLGNGDGTFTAAGPAQPIGGRVWVIVIDDVNGDGNLDMSAANSFSANGSILLGNGAGAFGAPATLATGFHTPSTDLGDLDGDGDADLVLSVFSGGFWRWYRNDGAGNFTFVEEFDAPSNPSCAVLFDTDDDGDLDMALTDEIADVILLMRNDPVTGVGPAAGPIAFALHTNSPNPTSGETRVRFVLDRAALVRLDVYDLGGRRVGGTDPAPFAAGAHGIRFGGRDPQGRSLAPGVYPYRVVAGGEARHGRIVVAR